MSEQPSPPANSATPPASSSSSENKQAAHPQAWLQAMYSAGRGGLSRGGGGGRGGGYNHRGRGNHYRGNNHHHHGRGGGGGNHYKPRGDRGDNNYYKTRGENREQQQRKREAPESEADSENKSKEPKIESTTNNGGEQILAEESSVTSSNGEENKGDLNEENVPEYIKFLQDYKKNYKNPIFSMLYKKPMETPEDIEKYREERRKNFPTKKNIIEKEKILSERRQKGEIIVGASEKVKSLLKVMGIEKDQREGDHDENGEENRSKSLIKNLLTQEISQDKIILLQCFRHLIFEDFYCAESELSSEVKEKLTKMKDLTKSEMKKLEEYRKKKLGLSSDEAVLISPSSSAGSSSGAGAGGTGEKTNVVHDDTVMKEFSSDDEEFGEMSDNDNNDDEDDLLNGVTSNETQQIDKMLKEIDQ